MIVRRVKVDRTRSSYAVLAATNCRLFVDEDVVAAMPHGESDEVDVIFFKLDRYVNDRDLDKEYESRGLKPADPYSQVAVNEDDPSFVNNHPNATHWKDEEAKWCFAAFFRWVGDERSVSVGRLDVDWYDCWWFAGLRK
jgi:hypothetical protein